MKEKNVKHITKTLAVVSLFAPITAQPLGIGDIELHSALNQKLNAEIRLHLAPGENPADISVRLAPPEKFDKAGVPWNYFLSKINFKTVEQANGSVVIKVTSNETLTEPFLDFLMEVSWPQGSQFREFTVLLDPPADYHQPILPSAASSTIQATPIKTTPVKRTAESRPVKQRAVSRVAASNITPQTPTDGEYGPTQKADNLWNIAKQLGSERGVSTHKMMTALFHANPDAFLEGNMDILKTDAVLKIPVTEAILGGKAASSEQKAAQKAPTLATKTVDASKALELEAPIEAKVAGTAQIDERSKPGDKTGITGDISEEGVDLGKGLELQDRIDQLEQQLNMMQQLVALKDQQLAALQGKDVDTTQQTVEQAQSLPTQAAQKPEETEQQPTPEQALKPAPVQKAPEAKPAPAPEKPKPAPVPATPIEPEEDFFSSSGYYLTVGGLGIGMLGLIGWLWWRKRKIDDDTNTDSMFASASQIKLPDSDSSLSVPVIDMNTTGSYDVGTVGESSFISDFTPSDFEAFDSDQTEVDPMSEADVYLAYGRYQQAEDLIRHAIDDQPDKDEYKLKLLEIFYANENKDGFTEYAQKLADAGKNTDRPFWTKVSDMAKELIPESPLFGGTPNPEQPTSKAADFEDEDNEDSFDFESPNDAVNLKTPPQSDIGEPESEPNEPVESDDNSLDFDLSSFSAEPEESNETNDDVESIDFDLGKFEEEEKPKSQGLKPDEALETFDFNFDMDTDTPADTENASDNNAPKLESFDISDLGSIGDEEKPVTDKKEAASNDLDASSDFDFNFDFNAPSASASESNSNEDFDLGVGDLTDMDEFETKIDLAKAYIDMGDSSAAKTIAEEVLQKGNPEQKQAAQAILDNVK